MLRLLPPEIIKKQKQEEEEEEEGKRPIQRGDHIELINKGTYDHLATWELSTSICALLPTTPRPHASPPPRP